MSEEEKDRIIKQLTKRCEQLEKEVKELQKQIGNEPRPPGGGWYA